MFNNGVVSTLRNLSINQWLWLYLGLALVVVARVTYNQHGWVNNDSLLYFEQARLIAGGEWQAASKLFNWNWPFYTSLIALVHVATSLDIHSSAQLLNIVLFLCFVRGFQKLIIEAGGTLSTLHWAHLLLLSSPYIVGDVLGMLLRDEGFWAFFTWSLVYFLRFMQIATWRNAFLFQVFICIATLFRIEAIAYLAALPLSIWFSNQVSIKKRFEQSLQLYILPIFAGLMIGIALISGLIQLEHLGRLKDIPHFIIQLFTQRLDFINQKADIIGAQVLGRFLDDYARLSLWSSLIIIVLLKTLKVAGLPALAAIVLPNRTWWKYLPTASRQVAIATLAISFVVSVVIILNVFVLSSRYVISAGIIMLVLASFALSHLQKNHSKWPTIFSFCILSLCFINNLWDKNHPDIDRLTVNYVASVNKTNKAVLYDTENARFYAHQPFLNRIKGIDLFKTETINQKIDEYSFVVVTIGKGNLANEYEKMTSTFLLQHKFKVIKTVYGWKKKTKALIYTRNEDI